MEVDLNQNKVAHGRFKSPTGSNRLQQLFPSTYSDRLSPGHPWHCLPVGQTSTMTGLGKVTPSKTRCQRMERTTSSDRSFQLLAVLVRTVLIQSGVDSADEGLKVCELAFAGTVWFSRSWLLTWMSSMLIMYIIASLRMRVPCDSVDQLNCCSILPTQHDACLQLFRSNRTCCSRIICYCTYNGSRKRIYTREHNQ